MELVIGPLADGWMEVQISHGGKRMKIVASRIHDSIAELAQMGLRLVGAATEGRCTFVEEPGAYTLVARKHSSEPDLVTIGIHFSDSWSDRNVMFAERSEKSFESVCSRRQLISAIGNALENVRTTYPPPVFRRLWGWEFPLKESESLAA